MNAPEISYFENSKLESVTLEKYYKGDLEYDQLTEDQKIKVYRLSVADDMLRAHGSIRKAQIPLIVYIKSYYVEKGLNKVYNNQNALSDLEDCQYYFGTNVIHNRNYHVDRVLEQIKQDRDSAIEKGNIECMIRCTKNYISVIEKLIPESNEGKSQEEKKQPLFKFDPKLLGVELPDPKELKRELKELARVGGKKQLDDEEIEEIQILSSYEED